MHRTTSHSIIYKYSVSRGTTVTSVNNFYYLSLKALRFYYLSLKGTMDGNLFRRRYACAKSSKERRHPVLCNSSYTENIFPVFRERFKGRGRYLQCCCHEPVHGQWPAFCDLFQKENPLGFINTVEKQHFTVQVMHMLSKG